MPFRLCAGLNAWMVFPPAPPLKMITSEKIVSISISKPSPISPVRSDGLTPSTPSVVDTMISAAANTHQATWMPEVASSDET